MPDQLVRLRAALADRYRVDSEIGRGGMSTVYLAEDLKHHRPVALKVLRPELAAALGPDRFLREIELSARLTHPHILPLHDSGNAAGLLYYVMPYVEGESLRDRLGREKQLPVEDALQISREVADALSYAHSHGVIHRDIKPENILLQAGHAVVADFGIARAIDAAGGASLTETGVSLGTPAYMSPEQAASSKNLDGRSDLYSLGCVLYEMLAGQPPFTGPTVESMIHQHLAAEPPHIMGIRPAVPAHVAATLERALAKTPADRFNPVALFAEALVPRGSTAPIPYPPEAGRSARRWAWQSVALVGIAALVLLGGVILAARSLRPVPPASGHPRTAIAVMPFQNLSAEGPHDYFSAGLHDELLTQLAKVSALKVIGRTTVLTYEDSSKRLSEIGRELAVGSIVEGSVQVVEDRLRVNVQLVDPVSEAHLWAERYDRTLDDAFAVQSDIARQIVAAVGARLRATERSAIAQAPTTNAQAYRLYLQGRFFWNRRSEAGLLEAIRLFQQATELDPTFARAYAGLADCYSLLVDRGLDRPRVGFERAKAEALRAIAIDSSIAEAYTSLGFVNHRYDWDAQAAIQNFEKAIALNPSYATAYQWLANVYRDLGRTAESLALFDKALAVDPLSLIINRGFGRALFVAGKYQEAITQLQSTLRLDSTFDPARETLARIHSHLGVHSEPLCGSQPCPINKTEAHAMTPHDAAVGTRLERLERTVRRSRFVAAVAGIGLLATWVSAARQEGQQGRDVLRAKLLIIEDAQGRDRIVLGAPMPDGRQDVGMQILSPDGAEQFGLGLKPDGAVSMGFDTKPGVGNPANRERLNMGVTARGQGWIRYLDNQTRARMFLRLDSADTPLVQLLDWPDDTRILVRQIGFAGESNLEWKR